MTDFPMTAAEIETAFTSQRGQYDVMQAVETFRRENKMRTGLNLTTEELRREALHWAGVRRA